MRLAAIAWPAVAEAARQWLLVIPIGSTEQHGPHLPLGTDAMVAEALSERLVRRRASLVIAPTLPYGASGEHGGFPGTLSIGSEVLRALIVELVRSADAFGGVILVNGHGGNAAAIRAAVTLLHDEGRRVMTWSPTPAVVARAGPVPDAHAGRSETSVLLAIAPEHVQLDRAQAGERRPLHEIMGSLHAKGVAGVTANGVLGDPRGSSAEEGDAVFDALETDLVASVDAWAEEAGAR